MARFLVECPGCETRIDPGATPPDRCPECGEEWPEALAGRLAELTARERPLGLNLLMLLFTFWAGLAALALLRYTGTEGPFIVGGQEVPKDQALNFLLPVLVPLTLATAGSALAIWLEKPWARPTTLIPFLLAMLLPSLASGQATVGPAGSSLVLIGLLVPVLGILVWYLYFRPDVRRYFDALREVGAREAGAREVGADPERGV